jgi:hypothetical protein
MRRQGSAAVFYTETGEMKYSPMVAVSMARYQIGHACMNNCAVVRSVEVDPLEVGDEARRIVLGR